MVHAELHVLGKKHFTTTQAERIVRGAVDLLRLEGPGSINAQRIAEHLQLHPQHVEELFPDDEALWTAVLDRAHNQLMSLLEHVELDSRNPLEGIRNIFEAHVSCIYRNPVITQLLVHLIQTKEPYLRRQVQGIAQEYESSLSILISLARAKGLVRAEVDPQAAARLFITMIHGLIFRMFISEDPALVQKAAGQVFSVYLAGIQTSVSDKRRSS